AGPLATLAGAHGHIHHEAVVYIRVAAGGVPFVLCILAGTGHLRGLADARTPLVIILASNVVNVIAEVVLVYVAGMGIAGSALGTVLAQIIGAAIFVTVSTGRGDRRLWKGAPHRDELVRLISAGGVLIVRTLALLAAWSGSTPSRRGSGPPRSPATRSPFKCGFSSGCRSTRWRCRPKSSWARRWARPVPARLRG
ncbi:MAG TPA: polysaccharide biosynthesis C-terminal domain-containing protein, partial [Acidimicrobiales bacterium]